MEAEQAINYKIVLVGNTSVGKSCIVHRFVNGKFNNDTQPTIGANFVSKFVEMDDGLRIKFDIWDTAGQERYRCLTPMYYKGAAVGLVVYDVTSTASFDAAKEWIKELQNNAPSSIMIALAGNKVDLRKQVPTEMAEEYARTHSLLFFEVSAKTGENIEESFVEIAKKLPRIPQQVKRDSMRLDNRSQKQDSWCCG